MAQLDDATEVWVVDPRDDAAGRWARCEAVERRRFLERGFFADHAAYHRCLDPYRAGSLFVAIVGRHSFGVVSVARLIVGSRSDLPLRRSLRSGDIDIVDPDARSAIVHRPWSVVEGAVASVPRSERAEVGRDATLLCHGAVLGVVVGEGLDWVVGGSDPTAVSLHRRGGAGGLVGVAGGGSDLTGDPAIVLTTRVAPLLECVQTLPWSDPVRRGWRGIRGALAAADR